MTSIIQILGFVLVAIAAFLLHPIIGLAVSGGLLVLIGHLLERPVKVPNAE